MLAAAAYFQVHNAVPYACHERCAQLQPDPQAATMFGKRSTSFTPVYTARPAPFELGFFSYHTQKPAAAQRCWRLEQAREALMPRRTNHAATNALTYTLK